MRLLRDILDKISSIAYRKTIFVKFESEQIAKRYEKKNGLVNLTKGSAGYDVVSCGYKQEGGDIVVNLGISVQIPVGYRLNLYPRSSMASKSTLTLANSVGIIDSDYRGVVTMRFRGQLTRKNKAFLRSGNRIGQFTLERKRVVNWVTTSELNDTERGTGGYGHTNNK